MIISDEQVQRVLAYLHTPTEQHDRTRPVDVPADLIERVRAALQDLPETRDERVVEAVARLQGNPPSADEVAAKIIARAISDSLR